MAYIDRDKVLKAVEKMDRLDKETKTKYEYDKKGFLLLINSAPTADVVEVKHGKWKNSGDCDWRCTNCNEYFTLDIDMHPIDDCGMNYCPNCGAKMDLNEN